MLGGKDVSPSYTWQMVKLTKARLKTLPPAGRGCRQPTHRFEFAFDAEAARDPSAASFLDGGPDPEPASSPSPYLTSPCSAADAI